MQIITIGLLARNSMIIRSLYTSFSTRFSHFIGCVNLRGFTLIELLVAIGVLGVLASGVIIAINPQEQFKKIEDGQRKHDLTKIQSALELYRGDMNYYPETLDELVSGEVSYIRELPSDPGSHGYIYTPQPGGCGNTITYCTGYQLYACLESYDKDADSQRVPPLSNQCISPLESYTVTNP